MRESRMSALVLMHIKYDMPVNFDEIVFVSQICTCINCFYSKGSNFTLTICLINFYSFFENLNGNLGFVVAVNVLLSIKRFFKQEKSLPK